MIPTKETDIIVQNNLGGLQVAMSLDATATAHLMKLLTDLYSDPELAIIREYSTNARDAHVAVGSSAPIQVTTPTPLSPYLRIKDNGPGLSVDDIENIYSKYGASTKRETNDQNGMLGLGCKSALTYTNQFTLVSVKNGVKSHVSISKVEDGTGVMEIVDISATDESNGVEIVVPIKNFASINTKVNNFFKFWPSGSVLVNGKEPEKINGKKVTDNIFIVEGVRESYIVMGNVPYPIDYQHQFQITQGYYSNFGVVAFVEMGDVNFTPSREALHYTQTTVATIKRIDNVITNNLQRAVTDDIADSPSHVEAIERFHQWKNILRGFSGSVVPTYRGLSVPLSFYPTGTSKEKEFITFRPAYDRGATNSTRYIDYSDVRSAVVILGFTFKKLSSVHRAKIRKWININNCTKKLFVITDEMFGLPWTNDIETVDWDEINKIRLYDKKSGASADKPKWSVLTGSYKATDEVDELDTTKPIYYLSPAEIVDGGEEDLTEFLSDATIVLINRNRWEKFEKEFNAKHVSVPIIDAYKKTLDAFTDVEKIIYYSGATDRSILKYLDETKVEDPELARLIGEVKNSSDNNVERYKKITFLASRFNIYLGHSGSVEKIESPLEKYPMIRLVNFIFWTNSLDHSYLYINAVYNKEKND